MEGPVEATVGGGCVLAGRGTLEVWSALAFWRSPGRSAPPV